MSIKQRKDDHIRINLEEDVSFPSLTTGFENYRFVHQALPEVDLADVQTAGAIFGKEVRAPILISSMTGGTEQAQNINRSLAIAAQERRVAMGVGSQRAGIERTETVNTFRVREFAPDILLLANLGGVQLNYGYTGEQCQRAVEMIEADALILHLNPLQEVVQEGGDTRWAGLVRRIAEVCDRIGVPVVVKEVGWGMSREAARQLIDAGVSAIDVAGAGGTSWSQVEMHRAPTERLRRLAAAVADWGIPTSQSLEWVRDVRTELGRDDVQIFASGGIRTGIDIAKAIALGADLVGLAGPFLKKAVLGAEDVVEEMELLEDELRIAMFASGSRTFNDLRREGALVRTGA